MLSNKISAVRSAINAFQRYKILNTLTHDCFESALETEQKLSIENKSNDLLFSFNHSLSCYSKMILHYMVVQF